MEELNTIIAGAIANTGGAGSAPITAPDPATPGGSPPAPTTPGDAAPGSAPAPSPEPFDEGFDYRTLPEDQQAAYRHWHGAFTRARQRDADRLREVEAQRQQYEGVPEEAISIARDYAARMQSGDVLGARALLEQQIAALDYLSGGQSGYPGAQGYQSPYQEPQYQEPNGYDPPDPVMQRLEMIERQNRMFQVQTELSMLQQRIGRTLSPLEQQRMLTMKQQAPQLTMDQVYYLTHRDQLMAAERERARQEALAAVQRAASQPAAPQGVPGREPVSPAQPADRRSIIAAAVADAMRGG